MSLILTDPVAPVVDVTLSFEPMQHRRANTSSGQSARLPAIAPRGDPDSSSVDGFAAPIDSASSSTDVRKSRLPPRSRSGCWTCRTRKVKCDEQRPSCGQCVRLEHTCDYNPRLSFRDDTPRVVERMQDVTRAGSTVWDSGASKPYQRQNQSSQDVLPPFSALTTDEEREKKAELVNPGTYHVVTNPSSFQTLPEYQEERPSTRRHTGSSDDFTGSEQGESSSDPNVIIIKKFVDPARRSTSQPSPRPTTNPASPAFPHATGPPQSANEDSGSGPGVLSSRTSEAARHGGRDTQLLHHYQTFVSPIILGKGRPRTGEDIFEVHAKTFSPLFHAMMALTALSLAEFTGGSSADALEHYQQGTIALKATVQSSQDSYSDGALFTHFILLLYEVLASADRQSNMWLHHTTQLQRILTLRHQAYGFEPYDFLVWEICCIDVFALLSRSGDGAFIELMVDQNMIPPPERCFHMPFSGEEHALRPEQQAYLPALLKLNRDAVLLAMKVGQVARDLRAETRQRQRQNPNQRVPQDVFASSRRNRVQALLSHMYDCRHAWMVHNPDYWSWLSGPTRVTTKIFYWVTLPYFLFRLCMIYAHTSMYEDQLREPALECDAEVATNSKEILQAAHSILSEHQFELRFISLALFIAGFATKDQDDKALALTLLRTIQEKVHGLNAAKVTVLLEMIYEKQRKAVMQTGNVGSVGWIEEMELSEQKFMLV